MDELIISVFCDVDNFYKKFKLYIKEHCLSCNEKLSTKMCSRLTETKVITICNVFHLSGYRTFKHYYNAGQPHKNFFEKFLPKDNFLFLYSLL